MWKVWLVISGICFIIEIGTAGFMMFWFAIGAIVALISSFFVDSIVTQTIVFIISSTILLFATRSFVNKFSKTDGKKTNAYSIQGKIGKVTRDIDPIEGKGQIKVDGEVWSAKSEDNTYISKDKEVIIDKIDGVKAVVKEV